MPGWRDGGKRPLVEVGVSRLDQAWFLASTVGAKIAFNLKQIHTAVH